MKAKLLLALFLFAIAVPVGATEITLSAGGTTVTLSGTGTINYSNPNLDGWNIKGVIGDSLSPSALPYGLDLSSLTATCLKKGGCSTDELDIYVSDTGFTTVAPSLMASYAGNQTGVGAGTALGVWYDTSNTLFAESNLVGFVGPWFGPGSFHGTVSGFGPGTSVPYSLTLWEGFVSGGHSASFSEDGNVSATPEPMSMLLLGTFLSLGGTLLSRKKRA